MLKKNERECGAAGEFPAADQDSKDAADLLRNELTTPANMLYTIAAYGYWRRTRQ